VRAGWSGSVDRHSAFHPSHILQNAGGWWWNRLASSSSPQAAPRARGGGGATLPPGMSQPDCMALGAPPRRLCGLHAAIAAEKAVLRPFSIPQVSMGNSHALVYYLGVTNPVQSPLDMLSLNQIQVKWYLYCLAFGCVIVYI
jgi:hypothetical protein